MIAALILVISVAMLGQFAIFFWRANLLAVAAQPISNRVRLAETSASNKLNQNDFQEVAALAKICPDMSSSSQGFSLVRVYYGALKAFAKLSSAILPAGSIWARREMVACARFVAVSLDSRLKSNQEFLAELRSY